MRIPALVAGLTALLALSACATQPTSPTIMVMPAPNKPFEVFVQDQQLCKAYAYRETAGQADAANRRGIGAAVVGTALGAGLGAAVDGGHGAGVGAAGGAVAGTVVGAGTSSEYGDSVQRQYNIAYAQCMYAKGNQVPGYQNVSTPSPPPPPPGYYGRN